MTTTARLFSALNAVVRPAVKLGLGSPPPLIGAGAVVLETTGRKSGLPRQVPLLAARAGDRVYASTIRSDSQWVRNLQADPDATVWLNGKPRRVTGTVRRGPLQIAQLALEPGATGV